MLSASLAASGGRPALTSLFEQQAALASAVSVQTLFPLLDLLPRELP